jgi:hypothetical protein
MAYIRSYTAHIQYMEIPFTVWANLKYMVLYSICTILDNLRNHTLVICVSDVLQVTWSEVRLTISDVPVRRIPIFRPYIWYGYGTVRSETVLNGQRKNTVQTV